MEISTKGLFLSHKDLEERVRKLEKQLSNKKSIGKKNPDYKKLYKESEKKYQELLNKISKNELTAPEFKRCVISESVMDKIAQSFIDDPNTNIYGFPDKIEKACYKTIGMRALGTVEKMCENFSFEFLGHRFHGVFEPIEENQSPVEEN